MNSKNILLKLTVILSFLFIISCNKENSTKSDNNQKKEQLVVSLPPLKWVVEKIAGENFEVTSIVSQNMNHELFEPKPKDLAILENTKLFFAYNTLPFEEHIIDSLSDKNKVVEVLNGVNDNMLIRSYHDHENDGDKDLNKKEHNNNIIDPHVWFSLDIMPLIANNVKEKLIAKYPDKKEEFIKNYTLFINEINDFKSKIDNDLKNKKNPSFIIYHPALNYFLKDRNLFQIEIEQDGKEPSAKYIKTVIDEARSKNIKTILVQPQFPKQSAEAISNEIPNSKVLPFNVLEENVFNNLQKFVDTLN